MRIRSTLVAVCFGLLGGAGAVWAADEGPSAKCMMCHAAAYEKILFYSYNEYYVSIDRYLLCYSQIWRKEVPIMFDWWKELETNWDQIVYLVHQFHPYYQRAHSLRPFPITAPNAEAACETIRTKIRNEVLNDPVEIMKDAKAFRDSDTIWNVLNQTWFGMPESSDVRYLPGFHTLCDLCSEYEG